MIKKIFLAFIILLLSPVTTHAQDSNWQIRNFDSEITINQDTSITVKETIEVDFRSLQKHGIFRTIPYLYSSNGKSIKTEINDISITNEDGEPYKWEQERNFQSIQFKIGDEDITISGKNTYVISYKVEDALQTYDGNMELFWNVVGTEWEVPILQVNAVLLSDHAEITRTECFTGPQGGDNKCPFEQEKNSVTFKSERPVRQGEDFTVAVQLSDTNNFIFPSLFEQTKDMILENISYLLAALPLIFIVFMWWKKGRDRSYISEVYYYKPSDKAERQAPVFPRLSMPLTYSPINGISPSEAGTIIDEHVHIEDVIAEIVELARMRYIKITKVGDKKWFKDQEFEFEKLKEADDKLEPHQKQILTALFKKAAKDKIKLSALANNFYGSLPKIKEDIYKQLISKNIFHSNPDKTKAIWITIFIILNIPIGYIVFFYSALYINFIPIILMIILFPIGILFALSMHRRTAWGYSLFQQTRGLREYIKVGKWRHNIAEKHLFFDEILPLAISLGVVKELTKEMDKLGIEPPSYLHGVETGNFATNFALLNSSMSRNLTASPQGSRSGGFSTSGRSSWSGGSGFSGGSSGGGFGGGGGGSW